MKSKLLTLLTVGILLISLVGCRGNEASDTSKETLDTNNEASDNTEEQVKEDDIYYEVFNDYGVSIGIDTKSIEYRDNRSIKIDLCGNNSNFEPFEVALLSVTVNGTDSNINSTSSYMYLGSSIVSDNKKESATNQSWYISLKEPVESVDTVEMSLLILNEEFGDKIETKPIKIELINEQYTVTETAVIDKDNTQCNVDKDEFEYINTYVKNKTDSVYEIFGTKNIGYIALNNEKAIKSISYNDGWLHMSTEDIIIDIETYISEAEYSIEYEKAHSTVSEKAIDTEINVISSENETSNISLLTFSREDGLKEVYITAYDNSNNTVANIDLTTTTLNNDELKDVVTDIINTYTLISMRGLDLNTF